MRYLTDDNRWVSTEDTPAIPEGTPTAEQLVERGLLHPSNLGLAQFDLLNDGIVPMNLVRLTDAPGGQPRWASYYDVMMTNPWGHGTLHTIARGLGRLPLKLYESELAEFSEPGTVQKIIHPNRGKGEGGKIAWALRYPMALPGDHDMPNSPPSRRALWYATVINKLIYGNALWEIRRDKTGIVGFAHHPMHLVEMDEDLQTYKVRKAVYDRYAFVNNPSSDKFERAFGPDQVVHFGLWESGRRPLNPSPVRSLAMSIALYDAISRHMLAFFNNGARVSGHLKVEPGTGQKVRDQIRDEVKKLYAGPQSAGKVLVSSGEWQAFTKEPEFDGIINLMKYSRDEIFVTYGVPPPVMGVIERAIMSNVREMRDQYVRDLIGPHAELLAGDFEAQVIDKIEALRERNVFAYFDVDEQLRPDLWKRASSFRNLMLAYTPDELRRIERQPALGHPGSETIWRPLNEGPLDNMPDYNLRDSVLERRVAIEEKRLDNEIKQDNKPEPEEKPAPNDEEGNDDDGDE